ncbi:hypothetical protein [Rugamonas aquatica]|uniref:Uncharacterized protein n=1 Tax=Rugamonas aquatica TaxID=2743357 RepID=A0A6A7MUP8_9BURK|nr:hypothetical protein [Rugamonas aquatica]MQA36721.1 hypothetical protein [Rugamonas aquatica]
MKLVKSSPAAQQRRRFLLQGAALTVATATCGLLSRKLGNVEQMMSSGVQEATASAPDLTAMVRSGQAVPLEQFFTSSENFAHFLVLTGKA